METAVLTAPRRAPVSPWTLAPTAVALAFGLAFLVLEPRPGDLAVHVFRAELFGREGFTVWNGLWYGGHHTPAYSVLAPPLAWLVGPRLLLVASGVACAALFERLVRTHFGAEREAGQELVWGLDQGDRQRGRLRAHVDPLRTRTTGLTRPPLRRRVSVDVVTCAFGSGAPR